MGRAKTVREDAQGGGRSTFKGKGNSGGRNGCSEPTVRKGGEPRRGEAAARQSQKPPGRGGAGKKAGRAKKGVDSVAEAVQNERARAQAEQDCAREADTAHEEAAPQVDPYIAHNEQNMYHARHLAGFAFEVTVQEGDRRFAINIQLFEEFGRFIGESARGLADYMGNHSVFEAIGAGIRGYFNAWAHPQRTADYIHEFGLRLRDRIFNHNRIEYHVTIGEEIFQAINVDTRPDANAVMDLKHERMLAYVYVEALKYVQSFGAYESRSPFRPQPFAVDLEFVSQLCAPHILLAPESKRKDMIASAARRLCSVNHNRYDVGGIVANSLLLAQLLSHYLVSRVTEHERYATF
jgi:hypothetical protein